jgi:hypothetical protein
MINSHKFADVISDLLKKYSKYFSPEGLQKIQEYIPRGYLPWFFKQVSLAIEQLTEEMGDVVHPSRKDAMFKDLLRTVMEDVDTYRDYIIAFDNNKQKIRQKGLSVNINDYDLSELKDLVNTVSPEQKYTKHVDLEKFKEYEVYSDPNWAVYEPENFEEECIVGAGTDWCTTRDADFWERYLYPQGHYDEDGNNVSGDRNPIYVLVNKNDKHRWQYDADTGNFFTEQDEPHDIKEFAVTYHDQLTESFLEFLAKTSEQKIFNYIQNIDSAEFIGFQLGIDVSRIHKDSGVLYMKSGLSLHNRELPNNNLSILADLGIKEISGSLSVLSCNITSLEGCPQIITNNFEIRDHITTLVGGPSQVGGNYIIHNTDISTLEGAPSSVPQKFDCSRNRLTSLAGCPRSVGGDFSCAANTLSSLKGGPEYVGRSFYCNFNEDLMSLEYAPQYVGTQIFCDHTGFSRQFGVTVLTLDQISQYNQITNNEQQLQNISEETSGELQESNNIQHEEKTASIYTEKRDLLLKYLRELTKTVNWMIKYVDEYRSQHSTNPSIEFARMYILRIEKITLDQISEDFSKVALYLKTYINNVFNSSEWKTACDTLKFYTDEIHRLKQNTIALDYEVPTIPSDYGYQFKRRSDHRSYTTSKCTYLYRYCFKHKSLKNKKYLKSN